VRPSAAAAMGRGAAAAAARAFGEALPSPRCDGGGGGAASARAGVGRQRCLREEAARHGVAQRDWWPCGANANRVVAYRGR
jgi:hypothetical protein